MNKPPNSRVNLDKAIERHFGTDARFVEARSILANAIVGQFLPDGVAKGGSALKLRFGTHGFRATRDLDAARRGGIADFERILGERLRAGWNGFSGTVAPDRRARPRGVPGEYVMQPFEIRLSYNGKSWCTVELEVGHDEIGDADDPEFFLSPDIASMFETLGLPKPSPVPLMPIPFQIAQKLHGATGPGSRRAHDLVDLQLILARGGGRTRGPSGARQAAPPDGPVSPLRGSPKATTEPHEACLTSAGRSPFAERSELRPSPHRRGAAVRARGA